MYVKYRLSLNNRMGGKMGENKLIGSSVYDLEGRKYIISKKIGEGAQGIIYESEDGFIIKINYTTRVDRKELVDRYKWIINKRVPKEMRVVTPIAILQEPYAGYVMVKVKGHIALDNYITPSKKVPLPEWYNYVTGGLKKRLEIGALLAKSLRNLHIFGLTYCDLSPSNVLVAQKQNSIVLIDPDNLTSTGTFKASILGTPRYIAPELFKGTIQPNSLSDTFSYAVILFEMLRLGHPMLGDKVLDGSPEEEEEALKGNGVYIDHPDDESNRNSRLNMTEVLLTSELKNLFKKVFVDGLNNYIKRPTLNEFRDACLRAKDLLIKCTNPDCNASFYFEENRENLCPWCGKKQDDTISLAFIENISLKEFEIIDVINQGQYKRLVAAPKNVNKFILNEGMQTLNKRHFEPMISTQKDERIITVNVDANKNVSVKKLIDIPIYMYNKENNTVKKLNIGTEEKMIRNKNALMFIKDFNIINNEPLNMDDVVEIYGKTAIMNYAALY